MASVSYAWSACMLFGVACTAIAPRSAQRACEVSTNCRSKLCHTDGHALCMGGLRLVLISLPFISSLVPFEPIIVWQEGDVLIPPEILEAVFINETVTVPSLRNALSNAISLIRDLCIDNEIVRQIVR